MASYCDEILYIKINKFPVVNKNDTVEYAYHEMVKHGLDRAVVVMSDRKPAGVITKRDIMKKLALTRTLRVDVGRLHVSSFMSSELYTIGERAKVIVASDIMSAHKIGSLPVVNEAGGLTGLVTRREIAMTVGSSVEVKAEEIMIYPPSVLTEDDKVTSARQLMLQYDALMIPVARDDKVIGYISISEVADALFNLQYLVDDKHRDKRLSQLRVGEIMREDVPLVTPGDPLGLVVKEALEKGSPGAIVMEGEKLVGVVTLKEVVNYVAKQSCPGE